VLFRSSSTDQAELTTEAKTFSAALKAAREAIETRTPEELSRIDEVAKQIADGTYSVPGDKVAQKIFGK
jgi:anti-sigma28 factor (negative regulator of flagellin synthesis)